MCDILMSRFSDNVINIQNMDLQLWVYFSSMFSMVLFLHRTTPEAVECRLRNKIAGTIPYTHGLLDTTELLDSGYHEEFDFVLLNHVMQATCTGMDDYTEALKRLKNYIKPGGHISVLDPLGETYSKIGNVKFQMYPLLYNEVIKSFREAGFEIVKSIQKPIKNDGNVFIDSGEWHLTVARKI